MEQIGIKLRKLREDRGLLLRQVAAQLEIDPSLLSKIERNEKRATREQIIFLESLFETRPNELLIQYLSDRMIQALNSEPSIALQVVEVVESRFNQLIQLED